MLLLCHELYTYYLEGVGQRATERLVGVSHNSVMNWVLEEVGGKALAHVSASEVEWVEADELWTYVGKKKRAAGYGGLLIVLCICATDLRNNINEVRKTGVYGKIKRALQVVCNPLSLRCDDDFGEPPSRAVLVGHGGVGGDGLERVPLEHGEAAQHPGRA